MKGFFNVFISQQAKFNGFEAGLENSEQEEYQKYRERQCAQAQALAYEQELEKEKRVNAVLEELKSMKEFMAESFKPDFVDWVNAHEDIKPRIEWFSKQFKKELCFAIDVRNVWRPDAVVCFIDSMVGLRGPERVIDFHPIFSDGELDPENGNDELLRLFLRQNQNATKFFYYNLTYLKEASAVWNQEHRSGDDQESPLKKQRTDPVKTSSAVAF